jgi:NADH-quinone oxidoreductase subunit A
MTTEPPGSLPTALSGRWRTAERFGDPRVRTSTTAAASAPSRPALDGRISEDQTVLSTLSDVVDPGLPVAGGALAAVLEPYVPAGIFLLVVVGTAAAMLGASSLLGPRPRPGAIKESTYECGVPLLAGSRQRFSVKFYLVAILFVLFDVETVFLIPWAVGFRELLGSMGVWVVVEMFVFIGVLAVGLLYAWRRGGLEWD